MAEPEEVPGSYGWQYSHMLSLFWRGWAGYFDNICRCTQSRVFKVNMLEHGACAADLSSMEAIFDSEKLQKDVSFGAMVPLNREVLSAKDYLPSIVSNGEAHDRQKEAIMRLFPWWTERLFNSINETFMKHMNTWETERDRNVENLLTRLLADHIGHGIAGVEIDHTHIQPWLGGIAGGIFGGSKAKAVAARKVFTQQILASPDLDKIVEMCSPFSDDKETVSEMLVFVTVFNALGGVRANFVSVIAEFEIASDELRKRLRDEVDSVVQTPAGLTLENIEKLKNVKNFILEVLRVHPVVRTFVGKSDKDQTLQSDDGRTFRIPAGVRVVGSADMVQKDDRYFPNPKEINIDRYEENKALLGKLVYSAGQYTSQPTATNHQCPAKDLTVTLATWFLAILLLNYEWTLKSRPSWQKDRDPLGMPDNALHLKTFTKRT